MAGLWDKCVSEGALSREGGRHGVFIRLSALPAALLRPHGLPYSAVLPQLVALHAVAVIEGDRAAAGDGVKAELLGVLGVSRPDVLSPGEGEHLYIQGHRQGDSKTRGLSFGVTENVKQRDPENSTDHTCLNHPASTVTNAW